MVYEVQSDEQLVSQFCGGDKPAFEELYGRYEKRLFTYLSRGISVQRDKGAVVVFPTSREMVEDVFQEVWTEFLSRPGQFDPDRASFRVYLFVKARSRFLDALRKIIPESGQSGIHNGDGGGQADDPVGNTSLPERDVDATKRLNLVFSSLPAEQREALLLASQGFSSAEIAEIQGVSLETARSRVRYAKQKARRAIDVGDLHD